MPFQSSIAMDSYEAYGEIWRTRMKAIRSKYHQIWTKIKNNQALVNNSVGAFVVKGGAMFVSLLTMPAYMAFFADARVLGLWFTMLAVLSWILTFDLGVGNGLRNLLVPSIVTNDAHEIKRFVSSAYISVTFLMLLFALAMYFLSPLIAWNRVFNIDIPLVSASTLRLSVMIIFIGILIQFLLKLISSILLAMQRAALPNFLILISNVLLLGFVMIYRNANLTNALVTLSIVYVFAMNLPTLIATLVVFATTLRASKPSFRFYSPSIAKKILKLGGMFFWANIMYLIITMTNEFLITWFSGPGFVVDYQIYNKLFNLIASLFILSLIPVWSAVTKAVAELRFAWIAKLYSLLKKIAVGAMLMEFILIAFLQPLLNLWLGKYSIKVNYGFALVFACSASLLIWNGIHQSLTNGFGELKAQMLFYSIGAIINIPLAWLMVSVMHSWIGVILANIVSMSIYSFIQPFHVSKMIQRRLQP
jgi:O-antigen/teichoic acid export membrane protein